MRDAITILLTVLAGGILSSPHLLGQFVIDPYKFAAGAPAPTYLLSEDAEGVGKPSGWTDAAGFPPDWDETALAIEGSESVEFPTASYFTDSPVFAVTSPCYIFFRVTVGINSGNAKLVLFLNSGATVADFEYRNAEVVFRINHGTAFQSSADLGSAGSYNVWIDYILGTGADGVMEMRVTVGGDLTKPALPTASIPNGTSTLGIDQLRLQGHANGIISDRIRVDDSPIGNNPL